MRTDAKRIAIFGAGQAGAMVRTWLPAAQEVLCFIDNDKEKQGKMLDGLPVLSLEEALRLQPEEIILAILNAEAERLGVTAAVGLYQEFGSPLPGAEAG